MSNAAIDKARAMREHPKGGRITGPQKCVLLLLADTSRDGVRAWPSVATLTADSGFSERGVRLALRGLEAGGTITPEVRPGLSTRWTLNLPDPAPSAGPQGLNGRHHTPAAGAPLAAGAGGHEMHPTPAPRAPLPRHDVPPSPAPRAPEPLEPKEVTQREPERGAAPAAPARPRAAPLEPSWFPSEEGQAHAATLGLDLGRTVRMFHANAKAKGLRMVDWHAAWALWCDREPAFAARPAPTGNGWTELAAQLRDRPEGSHPFLPAGALHHAP